MLRALTLAFLVVTAVTAVAAPAAAAPVSPGAASYLADHPGGTVVGANEISYDGGRFVVTLVPPVQDPAHTNAYVDCPKGWFCFYDRPDFGYPRGKLSSCYWQSLATYGWQDRVESAYYNLDRGAVQFFDYGRGMFTVGVGYRSIAYLGSDMNRATDVYRYC
ncbi:peptidase inhibitor family I36 protein [Dactylosporangium sp. NPDC005555]|uniref:peptidase inhibitor family I36 protein n=1 Tax=Dactylosporangium sp. NPDC005555 TaxID=3154889 RepID=UPI0033A2D117